MIATCGFGHPLSWNLNEADSAEMSFGDALQVVSRSIIARLLLPRWVYWLPIAKYEFDYSE